MTYRDRQRLADIQAAIEAIASHLRRGDLTDGLVFDAVRIRLLEIGEAVKALPAELLAAEPDIPWSQIARMRDHLAHRYFDTSHAILRATVDHDLPELDARDDRASVGQVAVKRPPEPPFALHSAASCPSPRPPNYPASFRAVQRGCPGGRLGAVRPMIAASGRSGDGTPSDPGGDVVVRRSGRERAYGQVWR